MVHIWQGAAVVTGRRRPEGLETFQDGAVAVEGDRVVAVGRGTDVRSRYPDAELTIMPSGVVVPGFVNGHHHQGLSPVRRGARAMSLEHVFTHRRTLAGPALYEDTLYGALQLLAAGVTTVNHLHVGRRGPWEEWRRDADTVLAAYSEAGLRVNFTFNFRDQNRLLYDNDAWFEANLPHDLRGQMASFLARQEIPLQTYLSELFVGLWEDHGRNGGAMARISLAPHNLHWCSDEAIIAIADVAARHNVHLNVHLLESQRQKLYALRRTGTTAIQHLRNLGVLDQRLTLLHAIWATADDVELLAQAQTRVCSSIGSNLLMGSGIPPLAYMRDRGVPLSVGLDEGGLDGRSDVFSDLRLTQGVQQRASQLSQTISCDEALAMATSGAAASTEFRDDVGMLEPGRYADFMVVDWDAVNDPGGPTGPTLVDDLVYKACTAHIDTVVVGGREVVRKGRHTWLDREDIARRVREQLRAQKESDDGQRELLHAVRPFVDKYWESYGEPENLTPFQAYNSTR
ncbi:formimidoylglutamate deiminase [Dactylosporangium fulvum]|uniref:Amidohydrolase family protein n=1 Tax=Dactylosporangium fulvum TaxID=53359 RepID=A0ABY5VUA2_9ACTN|nr:amidohydrolase family protein [Dactylosporangium fulvum]UWP80399.1 amidohydrolase family protein [Dactylosporangium fulvum]